MKLHSLALVTQTSWPHFGCFIKSTVSREHGRMDCMTQRLFVILEHLLLGSKCTVYDMLGLLCYYRLVSFRALRYIALHKGRQALIINKKHNVVGMGVPIL